MNIPKIKKPAAGTVLFAVFYIVAMALLLYKTNDISANFNVKYPIQKYVYYIGFVGLIAVLVFIFMKSVLAAHRSAEGQEERPHKLWYYPVLSGVLALVIMSLGYTYLGMWPLGKESAMILDMHHQYAPLLSKMSDMYKNGGNIFYSFDVGLGSSFIPMFGYYLASPFNLLLCLFPENFLPEGVLIVTLIKNMLTASAFAVCVQYIYRRRNAAIPVVSVMYSSMMYLLAYSWNIMWLDVIMFAPLVVMAFEHLMRRGKYLPYVLSLCYILYANYYIGFMVCVFLVLYFFAYLLRDRHSGTEIKTALVRFAVGSLVGGGIMMFMLLPIYFGLGATSASTANSSLPEFGSNFNILDIFNRFLYDVTPTNRSGNLPNVACGILAFVAVPLFATLKKIPIRRRIAYLGMFFVILFSMAINYLDLIWHGLHSPNDLPFRYSFLCSFVMLLMAYEVLLHIREVGLIQVGVTAVSLGAYLFVEQRFGTQELGASTIFVSALLILIYCAVLISVSEKFITVRTAYALIAVAVAAELVTNTGNVFVSLNSQEYYTDHSNYLDNDETVLIERTVARMNQISGGENVFCRSELLPRKTLIDSALFGYDGLSVFCSSTYYSVTRFMNSLGYQTNGVNSYLYKSFIAPVDNLMGIKYLAIDVDLQNHAQLERISSETYKGGNYYIYKNRDALPLAYAVSPETRNYGFSYYNPVQTVNSLYKTLTDTDGDIYYVNPVFVADNQLGATNNGNSFYIPDKGSVTFNISIEKAGQCYIYVDCYSAKLISVASPNLSTTVQANEPYLLDGGSLSAGQTVSVTVTCEAACSGNVYAVTLDSEVYQADLALLADEGLEVTDFSDSHIKGNITAFSDSTLMTTIPYDKGWTIRINGEKVDTYGIMKDTDKLSEGNDSEGALLACDLPAGVNTVELSFTPVGFVPGVIISVISLVLFVFLIVCTRRRKVDEQELEYRIELELGFIDPPSPEPEEDERLLDDAQPTSDTSEPYEDEAEAPDACAQGADNPDLSAAPDTADPAGSDLPDTADFDDGAPSADSTSAEKLNDGE